MARKVSSEKTEKDLLQEISAKLDRLTGVTAIQGKGLDAQIKILTALGLSSFEIGAILDKHPDYIREVRSKRKKGAKTRTKR